MNTIKNNILGLMFFSGILMCSPAVLSSSLVYTPTNPSFGGSALNGSILLNSANAQNTIKDPDLEEEEETALDEFNDRLQRSLLSRLTSSIAGNFVDADGSLIPGQTTTEDFIIDVIDEGDGSVRVTTTDRNTGDSTTFIVESQEF
ncbi:MAG: curli production assembly/transport component CsgF [Flavobacteriales bacterium]|jgi:curli production assembly/transport component CsgF